MNILRSLERHEEPVKMRAREVSERLVEIFPDACVATPCGVLGPLLCELERDHPRFGYVHREDNAVAFAAGIVMAGKHSLVLMQNSGIGQSVNVMASLVEPFQLPIGFIISIRGTENQPTLDHLGLPWRILTSRAYRQAVRWLETMVIERSQPAALLVPPQFLGWSFAA